MEGRKKSPNKRGGQAPHQGGGAAPPDKAPSSSHGVFARHLFYTGRHAYGAPTFCGCLRRVARVRPAPRAAIPYSSRTSPGRKTKGLLRAITPITSPRVRSRTSIPARPSLGPPQPQQAYVGTAASSTTNTEARRAATILLSPGVDIAISALQGSPTAGFLPRRPATRRPAAAV